MGGFEVTTEETIVVLEGGSFHVFPLKNYQPRGNTPYQQKPKPKQNSSLPSSAGSSTVVRADSSSSEQLNSSSSDKINRNRPHHANGSRLHHANGNRPQHVNGNRPQMNGNRPQEINGNKASSPGKRPPKTWEVCHSFVSNPDAGLNACNDSDWIAVMNTTTTNLSKLMQGGFSWSDNNVDGNDGYFEQHEEGIDQSYRAAGFRCSRHYTLKDNAEDPIWSAKLCIIARELSILTKFDLSKLTLDHLAKVEATDCQGRAVYFYSTDEELMHFNAVCNDRLLTGLWPPLNI